MDVPALIVLPAIIKARCIIEEARPNFAAALNVLGAGKDVAYTRGIENNGTFSVTIVEEIPVLKKPVNHTLVFECIVIWMSGDRNETMKKQKEVKLQCEYLI